MEERIMSEVFNGPSDVFAGIYRRIFENVGTAIVILAEDLSIVSVNREFETLSSYTRSEVEAKKNFREFLLEDDILLLESYEKLMTTNPSSFPVKVKIKLFDRYDTLKSVVATFASVGDRASMISMVDVTSAEFLEIELRECEMKYRGLFENMKNGFAMFEIIFDGHGKPSEFIILEANSVFESIAGIGRDEMMRCKLSPVNFRNDFIHDVVSSFYETALTGEIRNKSYYLEAENKWFEVLSYSPGYGLVAMLFVDVSPIKRSEIESRNMFTLLNSSINAISSPIAIIDDIGMIIFANSCWRESDSGNPFFGPGCVIGTNYLEYCDRLSWKFDRTAIDLKNSIFKAILGEHNNDVLNYGYISPDGRKHWYFTKTTHFEIAGRVNVVVSHVDITGLKKNEEALKLNESRLEALLKLSQMKDVSVKQLSNFALEEAVMVTESEIGFIGFVSEDEQKIEITSWSDKAMAQCAVQNKPIEFELEKTGVWGDVVRYRKPLILNDFSMPHKSKKGLPEGHVAIKKFMGIPVIDNGAVVIVAAVANKSDDYNESDVRQFTLFMDGMWKIIQKKNFEKSLLEANNRLKEIDQMKTDFLNTVSHELRTPLTSIVGFSKIIHKKLENAIQPVVEACGDKKVAKSCQQVMDNIHIIVEESERLTMLVNDILDVAKLDARKVEWRIKPFVIKDLIEKSLNAMHGFISMKNLSTFVEVAGDIPEVTGDPDKIMQVLVNLISNAVKFTEKGSITCFARVENEDVIVGIRDTGIGISDDDQKWVFEKFKQVGDTLTKKPAGTGLGLPICKQIIEYHGGGIRIESEPGKGSTFIFSLPLNTKSREQYDRNFERLIQKIKETIFDILLESEMNKILLVEDDAGMRRMMKNGLEKAGYVVFEALDGIDAIAKVKIEKNKPDLVMMRVSINKMSGFDIATILKNDRLTSGTPIAIIALSEGDASGRQIDIERYYIL